jgi:16S rRNA (cytosine967-C5)-methyltransferase
MFDSLIFTARVLTRVLSGATLPDAMAYFRFDDLPPQAKRFVREMVYGATRQWGFVSALTDTMASRKVEPPILKTLIGAALYQLTFMKQPDYAVVNNAVKAAHKLCPSGKSFTNALLRRFLRERDNLINKVNKNEAARFSYPDWWVKNIKKHYPKNWQAILETGNTQPPLTLRANRRVVSRDALLARFEDAGFAATAVGDDGLQLTKYVDLRSLPMFDEGGFSVQDASAQLAAPLLELKDGMRVLDACAAPGGKSAHILECADVQLTAMDSDATRVARLEENLKRLRLNAKVVVGDASAVSDAWWDGERFDRILVDAPCSASGVVRRHPDIKWLRRESDLKGFATQQSRILDALFPLLKPDGKLLYVTCSVFPEENESVVSAFLAQHKNARRESIMPQGQIIPTFEKDGLFFARFAAGV